MPLIGLSPIANIKGMEEGIDVEETADINAKMHIRHFDDAFNFSCQYS